MTGELPPRLRSFLAERLRPYDLVAFEGLWKLEQTQGEVQRQLTRRLPSAAAQLRAAARMFEGKGRRRAW